MIKIAIENKVYNLKNKDWEIILKRIKNIDLAKFKLEEKDFEEWADMLEEIEKKGKFLYELDKIFCY